MSAMAPTAGSETSSGDRRGPVPEVVSEIPQEYREYLAQGRIDRRRFEPVWQLCQSFLQNRQWVGWNYHERRIVELPNPDDRVRVTVNVLTQYLWTFLGKLTADDFRSDIRFRRDDGISRAYARQARRSFEWGWDEEWEADEKILEAMLYMGAFGIGALRVRPDPTYGKVVGQYPRDAAGKMHVTDKEDFMASAFDNGDPYNMDALREGRLCLDPLSPFNLIVPPGLFHERDFPWIGIERPVAVTSLEAIYPKAKGLKEEPMRAIDMIGVREDVNQASGAASGTLKGHVRLYTFYKMGTPQQPEGEMVCFAGNRLLDGPKPLPLQIREQGKAGIVFFKYHPVPGRFWPIGVIEPGIGPQRQRNRARSQWIEMKDRAGLGRVFAYKGTITSVNKPKGGVFELVEVMPGHDFPKETQGVPPGEWLQAEVAQNDADLNAVMGVRDVSLGAAPAGVSAYSAFALLAEQDDRRVGPVIRHIRLEIAKMSKLLLAGMRTYWLPGKEIPIAAGDDADEMLDFFLYDSSKLPEDCYIEIGRGAPLPQSQAAEAQKIFDIFDRGISSGQPLPLEWLTDSLKSGKAQPLPKKEPEMQLGHADLENNLLAMGQQVQVNPYDNDELHVQRHRLAQGSLAMIPEMAELVQLFEQHIQQHLQSAMQKNQAALPQGGLSGPSTNPGGFGAQAGNPAMGQAQPPATG